MLPSCGGAMARVVRTNGTSVTVGSLQRLCCPDTMIDSHHRSAVVRSEAEMTRVDTEPEAVLAAHATSQPLTEQELSTIDAWWPAANYLSVRRYSLWTTRCCANRCGPSTSSRGCSVIGAPPRA